MSKLINVYEKLKQEKVKSIIKKAKENGKI